MQMLPRSTQEKAKKFQIYFTFTSTDHLFWSRRLLFIKQPYFIFVFLHNPAHCIVLEVLLLTKQLLLTIAQQEGPNQQVHRSYPTLPDIEAYSKGRHTHQMSPASLRLSY